MKIQLLDRQTRKIERAAIEEPDLADTGNSPDRLVRGFWFQFQVRNGTGIQRNTHYFRYPGSQTEGVRMFVEVARRMMMPPESWVNGNGSAGGPAVQ